MQVRHGALPVHLVASSVRCASYLLALSVHLVCFRRGLVTSGSLFLFWMLEAVCGAFTFRTVVTSGGIKGESN